jgi:hypothetical protein
MGAHLPVTIETTCLQSRVGVTCGICLSKVSTRNMEPIIGCLLYYACSIGLYHILHEYVVAQMRGDMKVYATEFVSTLQVCADSVDHVLCTGHLVRV